MFGGALIIFVVAFVYYFLNTFMVTEREYAVYSAIEEPELPVISVVVDGRDINFMSGYRQDLGNEVASDCITPLPEDRQLQLHIHCYETEALEMSYEIRSLDTEHFIERTSINEFTSQADGELTVILPIQNMIQPDTQYLLNFKMDMGEEIINYYTKIIWPSTDDIYQMIDTALGFSEKSFDSNAARDLSLYLESNPSADTSSYATVNLDSGFNQITFGSTGMELSSDLHIKVKEYSGIMSAVEISYFSQTPAEANLNPDTYYNTDEFTMRMGSERVYMMKFQRKTNQIFSGNKHLFSGMRINLGIANEEVLQAIKSESLQYIAFKSGRELWIYDQNNKDAVNVFTFRSENDTLRADNDDHDIKILSLNDEGVLDFVVYGYINRGRHEGYNGIIYYRYDQETKSVSELFFMPLATSFENIKVELNELCIKSDTGMFYFKQNETVMAIDLTSNEIVNVVSDLATNRYAVSEDQTKVAWIEGTNYAANSIKLMDIMTGTTQSITGSSNEILSVVNFFGTDLIYGVSLPEDESRANGRIVALPMRALRIIAPDLTLIMQYEKAGLYLDNIEIEGDRIHIGQYKRDDSSGEYNFTSRDTIVSNAQSSEDISSCLATDTDDTKKTVYYIELDKNIRTTRTLTVEAPANISYQNSGTLEIVQTPSTSERRYMAYAYGSLKGVRYSLKEAIDLIYDDMGWIEDENAAVIYARADRGSSTYLQDPLSLAQPLLMNVASGFNGDTLTQDGYIVMDAYGVELDRLLNFVYKGCPILAYLNEQEYCLIYSYDSSSIGVFYPSAEEATEAQNIAENMSNEDAAMLFNLAHNNFIVFRSYEAAS